LSRSSKSSLIDADDSDHLPNVPAQGRSSTCDGDDRGDSDCDSDDVSDRV